MPEVWFPIEERNLAFGVPFYLNMLGLDFGYLFAVQYVASYGCDIPTIQFVSAIIATVTLLICALIIRNKPRAPPEHYNLQKRRPTLPQSLKMLFCDAFRCYGVFVLALFLGVSWSIFDVLGT